MLQNTLELHNDLCSSLTAQNKQCHEQKATLSMKDKELAQLREQLQKHEGKILAVYTTVLYSSA